MSEERAPNVRADSITSGAPADASSEELATEPPARLRRARTAAEDEKIAIEWAYDHAPWGTLASDATDLNRDRTCVKCGGALRAHTRHTHVCVGVQGYALEFLEKRAEGAEELLEAVREPLGNLLDALDDAHGDNDDADDNWMGLTRDDLREWLRSRAADVRAGRR